MAVEQLIEHDDAPLAALTWNLIAFGFAARHVIVGPLQNIPGPPGIVPDLMLLIGVVWIIAGASYGWLPMSIR